eukprot:m.182669 g.182669  ORF g.182669 m.182669 type:complete len:956 (-) comp17462_c0_seq2:449-3316(-)
MSLLVRASARVLPQRLPAPLSRSTARFIAGHHQTTLLRQRMQEQLLFHTRQPPRRYAASTAAGSMVGILLRRLVLYPTVVLTAIGTGLEKAKESVPELPTFGKLFSWVGDQYEALRKSLPGEKSTADAEGKDKAKKDDKGRVAGSGDGDDSDDDDDEKKSKKDADDEKARSAKEQLEKLAAEHDELLAKIAELTAALETEKENQAAATLAETSKLQEEIDRLSEENQELRRVMIVDELRNVKQGPRRAIDIFSDILDLRSRHDSAFQAHDHLPRVVVVGDQSSGKTSVLEVIVRARVFPRGLGEMMTRAPIQVTLSEGSEHTGQIKGEDRVYNLKNEPDLQVLRRRIEQLMMESIAPGEAVSMKTLALDIRGPGLQPMVLVDLPGIIQHHTQGMASNTKDNILTMCRKHIENPNSIILCIQDSSRDPEGSSVADLVHRADPAGDRTIFVLTKVDLAEKLKLPGGKLKAILKGQKFNMKAKAYFAVVTGTANPNDSIAKIRKSEREFFERSALAKEGVFTARRMGVDNLARSISDAFWERVRETVAVEAKEVATSLKKKENEWKNTFPGHHRQSRDDLFNVGRHQILANVSKFNDNMTASQWEEVLRCRIWEGFRSYVLDSLYMESAEANDPASFKTNVENMLDAWVGSELPHLSVEVARSTLLMEFMKVLDIEDEDQTLDKLKSSVKVVAASKFQWDPASAQRVQSVQRLMLRDDVVKTPRDWDTAVMFMMSKLSEEFQTTQEKIGEMVGPSSWTQWTRWQSKSAEQKMRAAVCNELVPLLSSSASPPSELQQEEIRAIQHNLKHKNGLEVSADKVEECYKVLHKQAFLVRSIKSASICQQRFGKHESENDVPNQLGCSDVLLFWRVHNMLTATANMLRLETMDYKRELEEEVRTYLNDIANDSEAKATLITGKKVSLAEDIEVLRHIQSKLDTFVKMLRKEKEGETAQASGRPE